MVRKKEIKEKIEKIEVLDQTHKISFLLLCHFGVSPVDYSDSVSINFDHHLRCGGWLNFEFS